MTTRKSDPKPAGKPKLTPMMQQFYELRSTLDADTILFFRMGDFYEVFGDDATTIAPKIGLVLTAREKGHGDKIPFCGVPHHSVKTYWQKLIALGYRVAIADQLEDPKQVKKGIVKRGIVKILSPGAIDDEDALEGDKPNYLMAVHQDPESRSWWAVIGDVSTGELRAGPVADAEGIAEVVYAFRPRELLCRKVLTAKLQDQLEGYMRQHPLLFGALPEGVLAHPPSAEALIDESLGQLPPALAVTEQGRVAIGAFLQRIKEQLIGLDSFLTVKALRDSDYLIIDETARRDLELFETALRREQRGSLYSEINRTQTPVGARRLRDALLRPFASLEPIQQRQDAVSFFVADTSGLLEQLRQSLKGMGDIRRLATAAYQGSIKPPQLSRLRGALERAVHCGELLASSDWLPQTRQEQLVAGLKRAAEPLAQIAGTLAEEPGALADKLTVIQSGLDGFLDDKVQLSQGGEAKIQAYEQQLRDETGISSLKVKRHKTFGLLIEVTKANVDRVPEGFHRRQTMVNGERYQTPTLTELDEQLSSALELAYQREAQLYAELLTRIKEYRVPLSDCAEAIAELDLVAGLGQRALEGGWTRAETVAESTTLQLRQARHPVVESLMGPENFTPNDILFDDKGRHLLITGPNMAGKSTIMRQTALCVILNQIGALLPCDSAQLPIIDRVFTRVGASDDLSKGQSTFMVEMVEAAQILRQATPKSLVLLDEVGRGTSSGDGLAIASALLEDLANRVSCFTLFATHYHELLAVSSGFPQVRPMATEVDTSGEQIRFTHRLVPGGCQNSYGIEVAGLAGMPTAVIERAKHYLAQQPMPAHGQESQPQLDSHLGQEPRPASQQEVGKAGAATRLTDGDVGKPENTDSRLTEVGELLLAVNIEKTTPLKALNILADYQSRLLTKQEEPTSIFDGFLAEDPDGAIL